MLFCSRLPQNMSACGLVTPLLKLCFSPLPISIHSHPKTGRTFDFTPASHLVILHSNISYLTGFRFKSLPVCNVSIMTATRSNLRVCWGVTSCELVDNISGLQRNWPAASKIMFQNDLSQVMFQENIKVPFSDPYPSYDFYC